MTYSLLEHPADVGIEATGSSLREAFEEAAHALLALILEISAPAASEQRLINLSCPDREQLLVRWLSEILYLFDGEAFVPSEIRFQAFSATGLTALLKGERLTRTRHRTKLDVKAVTYHQLLVEETAAGARIRVFLDI